MNYLENYRQNTITTQMPGQVIVLLYEGAIRFLKQAQRAVENQDYAQKGYSLGRAQDIIYELNASLNMDAGGEIAQNLRSLYTFIWIQLNRINLNNDSSMLKRLLGMLEQMAGAWKTISTQ